MASGAWYKGILLTAVLSCLLHEAMADCSNEGNSRSCDQCYQTLSSFLVNTSDNNFRLRKTFFPPDKTPPDFVTVTYQYNNMSNVNQTWYWSAGVFYFFQPKQVFQFTSLFFGTGDFLKGTVTLTLPAQCENAPEDFMEQLTQMVSSYRVLHAITIVIVYYIILLVSGLHGSTSESHACTQAQSLETVIAS